MTVGAEYFRIVSEINQTNQMTKNQNPNCDGANCKFSRGQVKVLPSGGDSNSILCRACFDFEMDYRRERNKELSKESQFDLPKWEDLKNY